jgi:hyaluronan synthase
MKVATIFYILLPITILILPLLMGYVLDIKLNIGSSNITFGIYFMILLLYTIVQYTCAILNRRNINNIKSSNNYSKKVSILVVGYKENIDYFKACINSINNLSYSNISLIVFVNDSDTIESMYMNNIFETILSSRYSQKIRSLNIKHNGKRNAMYRGFEEIKVDSSDYILTLDSDTILKSDCIERLVDVLDIKNKNKLFGGVTGHVRIFNDESVISLLSLIRYWFAFNVERAAQSYFGVVSCISGPLGLYRKDIIMEAKSDWIKQKFLGKECSYGDDRHLTYQVLKRNYSVGYTHLAEAYTETPTNITRWFKQQTRWNKSSIRELGWIINILDLHSFWLAFEQIYITIYYIVVLCSMLFMIWGKNIFYISSWLSIIFGLTFLKSMYPMIIECNPIYLLYPLYNMIFIFGFIPSKFSALLTINDISWGTSNRLNILSSFDASTIVPIVTWGIFLTSGIIYNWIVLSVVTKLDVIYFSSIIGVYGIWYTIVYIVSKRKLYQDSDSLNVILSKYSIQNNIE